MDPVWLYSIRSGERFRASVNQGLPLHFPTTLSIAVCLKVIACRFCDVVIVTHSVTSAFDDRIGFTTRFPL